MSILSQCGTESCELTKRSTGLDDYCQGDQSFCTDVSRKLEIVEDNIQYRFRDVRAVSRLSSSTLCTSIVGAEEAH